MDTTVDKVNFREYKKKATGFKSSECSNDWILVTKKYKNNGSNELDTTTENITFKKNGKIKIY